MTVVVVGRNTLSYTTECLSAMAAELRVALRAVNAAAQQCSARYSAHTYTSAVMLSGRINVAADRIAGMISVLDNVAMSMNSREFDRVAELRSGTVSLAAGWPTIASTLWQASTSREGIAGLRHVSTGIVPLIPQLPGSPSSVTVRETSRTDVTPPRTIAERIARIPGGEERIRIEQYGSGPIAQYEVYIAGTDSLIDSARPFGMESNIALATTHQSASLTAVTEALHRAGVGPDNPVVVTGHSQGGLLAVALANTDEWNVTGIVTAGTPLELLPAPQGIPMIHLEHLEDPVVALAGHPEGGRGETWLAPSPTGERMMGAHAAVGYVDTAKQVDSHPSDFVERVLRRWQGYGRGTATLYSAVTVPNNAQPTSG